ncbi:MAG: 5-histidylcysteine sulfoxide synthase [Campylobacterales bacterium]|nr:5-histidylcysteine sulfoxide synthase [Campylobacterales bacterium]
MIKVPFLTGLDPELKRGEIKTYFQHCYKRYESLFEVIADQKAFYQKADPLRHPILFYYGHTAVFFINKLKLAGLIDERIDARLESIFAVGVDEMSWDDLDESHYDWPTLEETQAYRDKVYEIVCGLIDTLPISLPITWESSWWIILMGIEHENIHLETSSVLIRQLPLEYIREDDRWDICHDPGTMTENRLKEVSGGSVHAGKNHDAEFYGWDNEYGEHYAQIPSFQASVFLVSNGEYLSFVEANGYGEDRYWSEEGKQWKAYQKARHPRFWRKEQHGYRLRTMTREIGLPLGWPVEVNYLEAEAFCAFMSEQTGLKLTLPTEDEYFRLRDVALVPPLAQWEEKAPGNIGLEGFASSVPVDTYEYHGFYDVIGNVWQWTRTPIYPFEGFKVHPIYDDFTVPTFDGKHNLIKGGSWISCGNLADGQSRYAFRRHFYQFAGFRYVQSAYEEEVNVGIYAKEGMVSQYCHFGWGENVLDVENYPSRCARMALRYMKEKPKRKALDIGCAIGRSTFELARGFDEVIGADFSARFIQYAQMLKENGILRYSVPMEAEIETLYEVNLKTFGLEQECQKVAFWQADACNLKPIFSGFDLIFAGNLIDRLYDPKKFLDSIPSRLNEKGLLILTSPYSWDEAFTPKEKWIGGYKRNGENITTLEGLGEILEPYFRLIDVQDIPFVIQESARKHQHTIAQMTVWEKR